MAITRSQGAAEEPVLASGKIARSAVEKTSSRKSVTPRATARQPLSPAKSVPSTSSGLGEQYQPTWPSLPPGTHHMEHTNAKNVRSNRVDLPATASKRGGLFGGRLPNESLSKPHDPMYTPIAPSHNPHNPLFGQPSPAKQPHDLSYTPTAHTYEPLFGQPSRGKQPMKARSPEEWRSTFDLGTRTQEYQKKLLQLKILLKGDPYPGFDEVSKSLEEAELKLYRIRMTRQGKDNGSVLDNYPYSAYDTTMPIDEVPKAHSTLFGGTGDGPGRSLFAYSPV